MLNCVMMCGYVCGFDYVCVSIYWVTVVAQTIQSASQPASQCILRISFFITVSYMFHTYSSSSSSSNKTIKRMCVRVTSLFVYSCTHYNFRFIEFIAIIAFFHIIQFILQFAHTTFVFLLLVSVVVVIVALYAVFFVIITLYVYC